MTYLVMASDTGSVVAQGSNLQDVVAEALELGYTQGYVTDQDGGYGDLFTLAEKYGLV